MTTRGFDCASDLSAHAGQIKAAGYGWVGRYYTSDRNNPKILKRAEALHLSSMGLFIVSVFENAGDHAGYFSFAQGIKDMDAATVCAVNVRQPDITPIYFAVDFDATDHDCNAFIIPYFKALHGTRGLYSVGVYGSGFACRRLLELGLVSFAWLAQSTGWAEYEAFKASGKANIIQLWTTEFHGLSIDGDISNGNGGGFKCL